MGRQPLIKLIEQQITKNDNNDTTDSDKSNKNRHSRNKIYIYIYIYIHIMYILIIMVMIKSRFLEPLTLGFPSSPQETQKLPTGLRRSTATLPKP